MTNRQILAALGMSLLSLQVLGADPLPRVFFTPQERAEVIQQRAAVVRGKPSDGNPVQGAAPMPVPEAVSAPPVPVARQLLKLEGLSIANGGATFAWINGQRYADGARLAGHRLEISAQGVVMVDDSGRRRRIRVGEALDAPAVPGGAKP